MEGALSGFAGRTRFTPGSWGMPIRSRPKGSTREPRKRGGGGQSLQCSPPRCVVYGRGLDRWEEDRTPSGSCPEAKKMEMEKPGELELSTAAENASGSRHPDPVQKLG